MARQRRDKPRFTGGIERLEDRRVMSADPLVDALSVELHTDDEPLAVEQHLLDEPDFWIDTSLQTGLDGYLDQVDQMLTQAHNLTGWFNVQSNYGFTGLGQTVAVIDSGIAYNHFALGGGFGSNYRVVGGWDFTEENDSNPLDDPGSGSHGSHVAGIVGSSDGTNTGVAPGVDLVALRVFNDAGQGFFSWIENALRWVINNRTSFENPITAINLSLGVSGVNSTTFLSSQLDDEFAALEAAGVFIAVSAGNSFASFNTPGLSNPAASQYVVPVMSTNDAGSMSSYSQRLDRAIAAPGQSIVSTVPVYDGSGNITGHTFASKSGTSMAAPYVAGASVLIRQAMQFVGMTNITQDMIYDHMMATADTFFDSATNLNYKRLNLSRAIDTLMPVDDYGSTAAAAHNLGTMTGPLNASGKIAKLNDVDCFKFTASSTGTVTFSATASAGMTAGWQVWGATATPGAPGTLTFSVVAGQTYTIGISTSTGLGNYSLSSAFTPSGPPAYVDWGTVSFNQVNNVTESTGEWYRVQASRTGIFTVQSQFNSAVTNTTLRLYNASMQLVANGIQAGAGVARVDAAATAGQVFYLFADMGNSDNTFKLLNLFTQTGSTVTVGGTAGSEAYVFTAGAYNILTVNGVGYGWTPGSATQFNIQAGGGSDSIVLNGSAATEVVWLEATRATMAGANYLVSAVDVETKTANSGGGAADFAYLFDSAGNDAVVATPNQITMTLANGDTSQVNGFARTRAWAMFGGVDTATFYDSAGNDVYKAGAVRGIMSGASYWNEAEGFDQTIAYATAGGFDTATFFDSAGNDAFTAWSDRATITGPGFSHEARDFNQVKAWSVVGGVDAATFYDSAGNDQYVAGAVRGIMSGAGYSNEAEGFDSTVAHATAGGYDTAKFVDSAGNDTFSAWSNRATMTGTGFAHDARGFEKVTARAVVGGLDAVHLYGSSSADSLTGSGNLATYSGLGFLYEMEGFDNVTAHGLLSDDDVDLNATDYVFTQVGA